MTKLSFFWVPLRICKYRYTQLRPNKVLRENTYSHRHLDTVVQSDRNRYRYGIKKCKRVQYKHLFICNKS